VQPFAVVAEFCGSFLLLQEGVLNKSRFKKW
jgi:hypothetical protein